MYNSKNEVLTKDRHEQDKWCVEMFRTIIQKYQFKYLEVESALVFTDLERIAIGCHFRGNTFVLFLLRDGNKEQEFRKSWV